MYDTATKNGNRNIWRKKPEFIIHQQLSENGEATEDVAFEVMPATDIVIGYRGRSPVNLLNARYVGATEEGDNFEAEYMLFV